MEIPASVKSFGNKAFFACNKLKSITVEWKETIEFDTDIFDNKSNITLYVPKGTGEIYDREGTWKDFKEIVEYPTPYSFSAPDMEVRLRQTLIMPILMVNKDDIMAYQFDLMLPANLAIDKDSEGKFLIKKANRYEDANQVINVTQLTDGTYRFLCFSMDKGKIMGSEGSLMNIYITIDDNVELGHYQGTMSNIVLTRANQKQKKLEATTFGITIKDLAKGDANGDGDINVSDIVEIVNYIMQKPSARFIERTADVNGDGEVNVTDIVLLVDLAMDFDASRSSERTLNASTAYDQLTLVGDGGQPLGLWLTNEAAYVASQFDIRLSAGQTLEGVALNDSRAGGHLLTCEKISDGLYRVVICSLTGNAYRGDSGELLTISVKGQGEVAVENILFVTADATEKRFADLHSGTTAIGTARLLAAPADIYTTDGRMVRSQATSLDGLKKGVYIVNGRKEVVR